MVNTIWNIYNVLHRFIEVREWQSHEPYADEAEFNKLMRNHNYIMIKGINNSGQSISIVLTAEICDIPNHKAEFVKMMTQINTVEVILISNKIITTGIREFANTLKPQLYSYTFDKFQIDMTRAPLVSKHRILNISEVVSLLSNLMKDPKDFPTIFTNDTMAVWIGAKPGDIIECTRVCESTGLCIIYRRCKIRI